MQRPTVAFVGAAPDTVGRGGEQFFAAAGTDGETVQVLVEHLVAEWAQALPVVATVVAAEDTVDFDAHPDCAMVMRIDHDIGDLGRAGETPFRDWGGEFFPVL